MSISVIEVRRDVCVGALSHKILSHPASLTFCRERFHLGAKLLPWCAAMVYCRNYSASWQSGTGIETAGTLASCARGGGRTTQRRWRSSSTSIARGSCDQPAQ